MHSDPPAYAPPAEHAAEHAAAHSGRDASEPDAECDPSDSDAYPADPHAHAYDHGPGELIMHHPVRWIIFGMLILYVINQPDQAAAMAGHLGTKIGQWSVSLGNSLGTFTNKLGS